MKKSELRQMIKEEINRLSELKKIVQEDHYSTSQMDTVEKTHDWKYKIGVKFFGTAAKSNIITIDKNTFDAIRKIMVLNK